MADNTLTTLNKLEAVLDSRTPQYVILRRNQSLFAITFLPYLANAIQRSFLLEQRLELVHQLGEEHFSHSLICKEIAEITDIRSWEERDNTTFTSLTSTSTPCPNETCKEPHIKDLGYQRNKCRLCDRRMKNKITPSASAALSTLFTPGTAVQISLDLNSETLTLILSQSNLTPPQIPPLIPTTTPSFTFFTHPTLHQLFFIFHSPDVASVQARMKHTMAIPGLLVHAEDAGVRIDRRIEVHDPTDVVFEEEDRDAGKFRSLFARKGFVGTEGALK
ncbi:hypothetical protein GQ44DRAFT_751739 [Phaeosphaeriaceae sp. PMI808]|nr:hypothetical protein GQ44DRAFT_751739 [Phaeosphaeriaceae sp. PMI808]